MYSLPDLSIRQLEYLVAVDESTSWAEAAEAVGVTPSALSQGLAELERRVGVVLLNVSVVEERFILMHDVLLDHARQIIGLTIDLSRWSTRMRNADEGTISVGMIDIAAVHYFLRSYKNFEKNTLTKFHLRVGSSQPLTQALSSGDLDLAVCVEPKELKSG